MDEAEYTIQELTELSGVPRRTVHFYTQQGILPPPQGAGLGARYHQIHLLRLRAVPVLRSRGLRLDEIRERLSGMDLEATRELLKASSTSAPASMPKSVASVHEPSPAWPQPPSIASSSQPLVPDLSLQPARSYLHYPLPAGVEIVAPSDLDLETRRKLSQLLHEAARIFLISEKVMNPEEHKDHEEES